ncbi:restriction endonuclease subunit S [Enterobacter ludwigii]|uniref:restriction endonuclease subunit S n=1 Tax=Enterobacter ludwigii TaxID=299767 RepID=UPI003BEEF93B
MVPKLRFRKFTNEWCESLLGNIVDIKSGNSPSTYDLSSEGDYPFVKVEDMNNCIKYQIDAREYVINSNFCFPIGSVIFPKRGAAIMNNKVRILNQNSCADTNMMALIAKHINPEFLYYLINLIGLYKIADTSTIPQINNKHISPFKVNIPSEEEQTKIANFLASVDEKITLLNKHYDLLCQYKKGMMQKLFSQELRFKDENGEGFPEWDYDEVSALVSNKSKKYNPVSGINYPCIELDCISQESGQLLTTVDSLQQQSIKNIFGEGDVLFGKLRPYLRKYILATFDGVCSSEIWVLKGILMHNAYLYQFVQTDFFINLANKSTGSKMPRADWDTISSTFVFYPCLEEQKKIADFLSAIDNKITTQKAELDKLKVWKHGLLQQMFV